jgi:CheY-like chemotaxis protein
MAVKRALIVDDSRSARVFLEQILEKYEIDVDTAESAEAAIEYLAANRPDVIFMDHMMPGMDGFQAVQAIKNNPRTATIPIMMYTSQEGELYLGQARALGAVGVLPKQIKQADVSKVLYQLRLVEDRRAAEPSEPLAEAPPPDDPVPSPLSKPLTETALREHFAEARRALIASIDTQTDRIGAELRALLLERTPYSPSAWQSAEPPWAWITTSGVAVVLALVFASLWIREENRLAGVNAELMQLQARIEPAVAAAAEDAVRAALRKQPVVQESSSAAAPSKSAPGPHPVAASELRPLIMTVPYGADAMAGGRLESIRQFLYRLAHDGVTGVVDIRTFAGRYCLVGNAQDGFSLAPDDMPYAKCDLVGNPVDDALTPVQRTPVALANLVGEIRHSTRGALDVQLSVGDATVTFVPYPVVGGDLTAGEWNRAGSSNNRVELRVR